MSLWHRVISVLRKPPVRLERAEADQERLRQSVDVQLVRHQEILASAFSKADTALRLRRSRGE